MGMSDDADSVRDAPPSDTLRYLAQRHHDELATTPPPIPEASKLLAEKDEEGHEPLALAVLHRQPDIIPLLLQLGADVDAADSRSNTALMLAAARGEGFAVDHLLGHGANTSCRDAVGRCAADLARTPAIRESLRRQAVVARLPRGTSVGARQSHAEIPSPDTCAGQFRLRLEGLPQRKASQVVENHIIAFMARLGVGNPLRLKVALDPITERTRGYAHVVFVDEESMNEVIRHNGDPLCGGTVRIVREPQLG